MNIDGEKYLGLYSIDEFFGRATVGQIEGISERCASWLDAQQAHRETELARRAEKIEDLSALQEALRSQFHDLPIIRNLIPDVAEAFDVLESRS